MGRLGKDFKRFPHRCTIYTEKEPTGFETEEELENMKQVLWDGVCRKEFMSVGYGQEYVVKADYRVQLGEVVDGKEVGAVVPCITAGMSISVTDLQGTNEYSVKDAYAGQLGTSVYCDRANT